MKTTFLATLLLALAWSAPAAPNPADYTITVHVRSSRLVNMFAGKDAFLAQYLTVSINGKKYELEAAGGSRLRLGDYKAKVEKDNSPRPYEYDRAYEFLFADGSTRKYWVVGEEE